MEAIEIQTGSKPAASILWLHGLGADGHDFEPIVPELKLAKPVRFVFPHAPVRPVTINQGMPIFMAHGRYDDIIPPRRADESRKLLEAAGYRVEWHEYPMPHSVCAEEIADIAAFLARIV